MGQDRAISRLEDAEGMGAVRKKTARYMINFTPEENIKLKAAADRTHMTISAIVRFCVLHMLDGNVEDILISCMRGSEKGDQHDKN